jgi:acetoin utilization deacetylase AcuC-like enzyme
MDAHRRMHVVEDPRFMDHQAPQGHPEREERLIAVSQALASHAEQSPHSIARIEPRLASDDEILRIHSRQHLQQVAAAARRAPTNLDPDTYVAPASDEVAHLAAGSCVDLALQIARGEAETGFAALRPPGHHAEFDRAMGFCLFNNIAIAARALRVEAGLDKLLILDWDVHHGNGTQHSFEADPSVLYVSTHQFPFYPGTGAAGEAGVGRGEGATVNIPLPAGCGDAEYIGAFQHVLVPVVEQYQPQMILVSCGFDAHASDPLASMRVSSEGYLAMTRIVRDLAERVCQGRLLFVLEGGYSPVSLTEGTLAVLQGALEPAPVSLPPTVELEEGGNLRAAVAEVSAAHRLSYRGLPEL